MRNGWMAPLGILMVVAGIALGLYVGLWWAFIGGIVMFIEAVKVDPINALDIALSIARVFTAGIVGGLSFAVLAVPGIEFIKAA